ncbi:family 43 glycosylhydrolase [Pseudoduganella lutea]|uniref:family 43 glycosylhydrolase n=1 Tax=Pseudoduganella lutea TaxID=321985 RepID=UPI0013EE501F|nr:family 43 glycosylhydrolase [Pseudoduganella lutea]
MRSCLFLLAAVFHAAAAAQVPTTYHNPLPVRLASGELAQNCADPAVLRDPQAAQATWYLYCTTDPVSRNEREGDGYRFRFLPVYRSTDLVHWDWVSDAFTDRPAPAAPKSWLWAPEPQYHDGRYWLYYTITDTADAHSPEPGCDGDSSIGVASSASPAGPWQASGKPVVGPRRAAPGCKFDWTFDPDVVVDDRGTRWLYYGSYGGGLFVQRLAADGLSVEGEPRRVGTSGRYEGAEVVRHDGWYYLFASATDCCAGPLTGYALHVGRAASPLGPFLDRQGNDMAAARAGGTPVLPQSGNRWVGAGHNSVLQDAAGQWWTIYHAIDLADPVFAPGLTRRPALLDRVDWVGGWPVVAEGQGPSDRALPAPATTAGARDPPRRLPAPASTCACFGARTSRNRQPRPGAGCATPARGVRRRKAWPGARSPVTCTWTPTRRRCCRAHCRLALATCASKRGCGSMRRTIAARRMCRPASWQCGMTTTT